MPPIERLEWDSAFFGVPIGRVSLSGASAKQVADAVNWADCVGLECLYWLIDGYDLTSLKAAETCGFHLVDIRVTFELPLSSRGQSDHPGAKLVRSLQPGDLLDLLTLARESHRQSRFFYDGHFSESKCDDMYEEWIKKAMNGPPYTILVAEHEDQPAGYCVCHQTTEGIGEIGLLAVAPNYHRRHIGTALVSAALDYFAVKGMSTSTVVTQGRNIAAQRLYQSCGFVTKSMNLWYHRWKQRLKN
jgi:dTDP-4-amino-4,6-dideoxy-D-galactose acyltransferase